MKLSCLVKHFHNANPCYAVLTGLQTVTYDPRVIALLGTSIEWKTPSEFFSSTDSAEVSSVLRVLLTTDGSMTTALEALRMGPVQLEVVRQGEEPMDDATALCLGVPPQQPAVARQVWLTHEGCKLLYAFSLLPLATLSPDLAEGIRRQAQPLGRLLDASGRAAIREGLRIGRVSDPALAVALGASPSERLWCRTYRLMAEGALSASILEIFSPSLAD